MKDLTQKEFFIHYYTKNFKNIKEKKEVKNYLDSIIDFYELATPKDEKTVFYPAWHPLSVFMDNTIFKCNLLKEGGNAPKFNSDHSFSFINGLFFASYDKSAIEKAKEAVQWANEESFFKNDFTYTLIKLNKGYQKNAHPCLLTVNLTQNRGNLNKNFIDKREINFSSCRIQNIFDLFIYKAYEYIRIYKNKEPIFSLINELGLNMLPLQIQMVVVSLLTNWILETKEQY